MDEKKESKKEAHKEDGMMMAGDGDPAAKASDPSMSTPIDPDGSGDPAATADHPDASQDVELFKQLIQQYLGDDEMGNEEAMKMCQSVYGEAIADGKSPEDAGKIAGHGMQAAMYHSKKEAREAAAKTEAELPADQASHDDPPVSTPGEPGLKKGALKASKEGLPPPKAAQSMDKSSDGMDKEESHKESRVVQLTAENARLKETMRKIEVKAHLEKILEGSGLPKSATNAFRDLVKDKRVVADIDTAWKTFKTAFTESKPSSGFYFGVEKETPFLESRTSAEGTKSVGFSDCTTNNIKI